MTPTPTLTLTLGCPGAGKTTWVNANLGSAVLCSTEKLRLEQHRFDERARRAFLSSLITRAERALGAGNDVVMDGCNTLKQHRSRWRRLGRKHGAHTRLVVVHAPLSVLIDVQRHRAQPVDEDRVREYPDELRVALLSVPREGWGEVVHIGRERAEVGEPVAAGPHWLSEDTP